MDIIDKQIEMIESAIKSKEEDKKIIEGEISGLYQALNIIKSIKNRAK